VKECRVQARFQTVEMNADELRVRNIEDSSRPGERRGPDIAIDISGRENGKTMLRKKLADRGRYGVAVHTLQIASLFEDADALLDGEFTGMRW
jgi:hypothetical protein